MNDKTNMNDNETKPDAETRPFEVLVRRIGKIAGIIGIICCTISMIRYGIEGKYLASIFFLLLLKMISDEKF